MTKTTTRFLALFAALVAFSPLAYAEPVVDELDSLLDEIAKERQTPIALAKLQAIQQLAPLVHSDLYANKLADASEKIKDPLVKFQLYQEMTKARHELRDYAFGPDGMKGPLGKQGCVINWEVVGPFSNENMEGLNTPLGPEIEPGPFAGTLTQVEWRPLPRFDRYCVFPLATTVQPSTSAVAYVATMLKSDKAQKAALMLGANGAYKAWVNGKLVAKRDEDAGMSVDNDAWQIDLQKGDNEIVLKVGSTSDGGLGFVARVTDTKGNPIQLPSSGTRPAKPLEDGKPLPLPMGILDQVKTASTKLKGDDAIWNAWLWKSINWQNVATPWRDVANRILENPKSVSPRRQSLAASLYEERWKQLQLVTAAYERAKEDPFVVLRMAREWESGMSEGQRLQAKQLFEKAIKKNPDFLFATLELADWYENRGLDEAAYKILEAKRTNDTLRVRAYYARYLNLFETYGTASKVHDLKLQGLQFSAVTGSMWWDLIREFSARGKYDEALALIREYRALAPSSPFAARKEAQLLRAMGKPEAALAVYEKLVKQAPGDASLYKEQADLLIALDKEEAAIASLKQGLLQRPQDQTIRDYLSYLQPNQDRYWEPWLVEDVREFAKNTKPGPFEYDTIIDQTIVRVNPNGLSEEVNQRVDRVLTPEGIDTAKVHRVAFQSGDEMVDVLRVRVHKADGTISEDYDRWESGGSRKGSTTYNDTAYVTIQANNVGVGDLIEVQYRLSQVANHNFRGDYFGDIAYLQGARPIGFARYAVIYPDSWNLHFRAPSLAHDKYENVLPDQTPVTKGFKSTAFVMRDVPHVESDPGQPGTSDVYDYVLVSNKETYDEIGTWWWNLVKEQLIVDEAIRDKVKELVKGKRTDDEKIQAIHNYVVRNTRYLHVGLGIHGWKPYRTTTAFRNRYGDCKDKASLLKVMLEEAGIDANLVLVRTRRLGKVESFPASMHVFNHAITYVPSKNLYLDGTAEFNGTTELTSMDQGAQALVIEDGGKANFVELPIDKPGQNIMQTTLEIDLTGEKPVTKGTIVATGANAVYYRSALEDPERRDEVLEKQLSRRYPGAKLITAKYKNLKDLEKPTRIEFTFEGGQIRKQDGSRSYLLPLVSRKDLLSAYAKQSKRTQDLTIRVPFSNETTVRYRIPKQETFDTIPSNSKVESKFGKLSIDYKKDGDELLVDVSYELSNQRVTVEEYQEFRTFLAEVTDALNASVRLGDDK